MFAISGCDDRWAVPGHYTTHCEADAETTNFIEAFQI